MKQFIIFDTPNEKGLVRLTGKDYNYLVSVRRLKKHQSLKVLLKGKDLYNAEIYEINTEIKFIEIKILDLIENFECANSEVSKLPKIILLQWVIKGQRMDLVIRQATEAGVDSIFPVFGNFSVVKKESLSQFDRRNRIIREARQQSGSLIDTKLFKTQNLEDVLYQVNNIIGHEYSDKVCKFMLTEKKNSRRDQFHESNFFSELYTKPEFIILAIGCEGGISSEEEKILVENDFKTVHFNTNILRAETAAIYSIAAVQSITQMFIENIY